MWPLPQRTCRGIGGRIFWRSWIVFQNRPLCTRRCSACRSRTFISSPKRGTSGASLPDASSPGPCAGLTMDTEFYIRPCEVMVKASEKLPQVSQKFKANVFWMGKQPLVQSKVYKLKIASQQVPAVVSRVLHVLNAAELVSSQKSYVDRHEVGECVFEVMKPVAFDLAGDIAATGRFVLVDQYEIAGGGIILSPVFDSDS